MGPPNPRVSAARLAELLGDWRTGGPANERLATGIRSLILDGRLGVQTQVPPERGLAKELRLGRNTVTAAYARLRDDGYLVSRQGSGTVTTLPVGHRFSGDTTVPPTVRFDLTVAALSAPVEMGEAVSAAQGDLSRWLDHHGYNPFGMPPLRSELALRYTARGVPTTADEILVTNGALHALHLIIAALVQPRDNVAIETPTYPAALDLLGASRARMFPTPVVGLGWDEEQLRSVFQRTNPRLAYFIADFHNPTGALMPESVRGLVGSLAARAGTFLVVDETSLDLAIDDVESPSPLTTLDRRHSLNVGSMSKGYWGGLRVGWIRASPGVLEVIVRARAVTDMAGPVLDQLVALHLLRNSAVIISARRDEARLRRDTMLAALRRHLPNWKVTPPKGGLSLWVELPLPSATALAGRALRQGILLTPGPRFAPDDVTHERYLRVPYSLAPEQLMEAISALAEVAGEAGETDRRPEPPVLGYSATEGPASCRPTTPGSRVVGATSS